MGLPDNIMHDVERQKSLRQLVDQGTYRDIERIAGSSTPILFASVDSAAEFLQDDSPELRRAAVQVLAYYWKITPDNPVARKIHSMAKGDVDSRVKQESLCGGACIYAGTDDVELGELLARQILNDSIDIDSRAEAYYSLRRLQHKWLPLDLMLSFSFPDDVEWSYVRRFLDTTRTPEPVDSLKGFAEAFLGQKRGCH